MTECSECMQEFKRGEKVFACTNGKRLTERIAIDIDIYHKDCWNKIHSDAPNPLTDDLLKSITAWKEKFREEYL